MVETPETNPYWRIDSITIDGDVASIRVEDDWPGMRFPDVLTLLHHEGRRVIVSKVFHYRLTDPRALLVAPIDPR